MSWQFRIGMLAAALLTMNIALAADENSLSDEEKKEGFVALFNGKDLTNWRFGDKDVLTAPLPENCKVEEGVIKVTGGGSPHLASAKEYTDFDFRFQWRGVKDKYNSGFFVRSGKKLGANQINLAKGSEGNFFGGKMKGGKAVPELQKPSGEWNEWRVLVVGDKMTFWCNGKLAWEGMEFEAKSGYLGLQAEGAPLEFRNLRIKEMATAK